jgi:hypothetical protein
LPFGSGTVRTAHGLLPVPAPAALRLMLGLPTRPGPPHATGELCTPTGVALLRSLAPSVAQSWASGRPPPGFTPTHVGLGAGAKDFPGHPNVVRAVLGYAPRNAPAAAAAGAAPHSAPLPPLPWASAPLPPLPWASAPLPPLPWASGAAHDHSHDHSHDHARTHNYPGVGTSPDAASRSTSGGGDGDWDTAQLFEVACNLDDMPAENGCAKNPVKRIISCSRSGGI